MSQTLKKRSGITLQTTDLLDAVTAAGKGIATRSPKAVLHNVRIGDGLVSGTDLELRVDVALDVQCEPMLLPFDRLLQILRAVDRAGEVTLTPHATTCVVKSGRGTWTLPVEAAAEYPTWEPENLQSVCRLPSDQFVRAARATAYATDTESSRYALGAVLVEVKDGNPTWVATDGRRLAAVETETDQAVDDRSVLVPSRVLSIVQSLAGGEGSVQIEATPKEVVFSVNNVTVTALLTEGRFPRWRDVVGEPEGEATVVGVAELLEGVRAAAIVTSEQSKGVDFTWHGDELKLAARSSEAGESEVVVPVINPGEAKIGKLDPRFVSEYLRHLPADEEPHVDIYAKDHESRVLLRCGPYTGVIMPLAKDA